jgi:hypothetical protein
MKLDCANIFCVFGAIARCLDNNPGAATRLRDATARDARGPSPAQLHGARLLPIDATSRESESVNRCRPYCRPDVLPRAMNTCLIARLLFSFMSRPSGVMTGRRSTVGRARRGQRRRQSSSSRAALSVASCSAAVRCTCSPSPTHEKRRVMKNTGICRVRLGGQVTRPC